jgi:probable rRNA maturation factor
MAASNIPISARRDPLPRIEISDEQSILVLDHRRLVGAIERVLRGEAVGEADISLAIIDDARIRELNARYLNHDYATDVLSFLLDSGPGYVEGEIIVSAEMAVARSAEFGWSGADELLLYVVHGTLHLVGYDDHEPDDRAKMRAREERYAKDEG